jgi:DNA-binding helix-hairpin-helix protein with protein kinase domain
MIAHPSKQTVELGQKIAQGGEGAIFTVVGQPSQVAKVYSEPWLHSRADKLHAMLARPPSDPTLPLGHTSIGWPTAILQEGGACVGFLMPRFDSRRNKPLFHFYNPHSRRDVAPGFTWEYLVQIGANMASVVAALHAAGYVIGDLNESNFMVSDRALISLVDCDSMQVPRADGRGYFRCTVAKPEYCAPELHGVHLSKVDRSTAQDNFALGVIVFQLLMEGIHPFAGVWIGEGDPTSAEKMRSGQSPYSGSRRMLPPPGALPISILPATIRSLVTRCLGADRGHCRPESRPSAQEWYKALTQMKRQLKRCDSNGQHCFPEHLAHCPWCDRREREGIDSYPMLGASR